MKSPFTRLIILLLVLVSSSCSEKAPETLITYPAIPGLTSSDLYTVTVNGQEIWTEKFRTSMDIDGLPDWFTTVPYTQVQQEVHITNFSCKDTLSVKIEIAADIEEVHVRPKSRNIELSVIGKVLEFKLLGPDKLYIEMDNLPPLCFFANPIEQDQPGKNDPNLRYFGPGVHKPGLMTLKDNEQVYIAGGAIVYGAIQADKASNIKVYGRGILDGNFEHKRMVRINDTKGIEFTGLLIRNGVSWTNTLTNCEDVLYKDVKVLSFGPGGDGINPLGSRNFTIDHCFLRCTDDCIAIKSPDATHVVRNIRVINNTMIGYAFSDGVTIGFETNGRTVSDVMVKNCDVLIARGGSRVDGHSAFSIICDGPALISNILYEDIRAEERMYKLFELNITDGTKYGINPAGHIDGVRLKNISWASERPIILKGFDEDHIVQNVTFENCTIAGKPLVEAREDIFEIGEFVKGVSFR